MTSLLEKRRFGRSHKDMRLGGSSPEAGTALTDTNRVMAKSGTTFVRRDAPCVEALRRGSEPPRDGASDYNPSFPLPRPRPTCPRISPFENFVVITFT